MFVVEVESLGNKKVQVELVMDPHVPQSGQEEE
jgi:hypothetical protein